MSHVSPISNQLLSVLRVTHLTGHFTAFGGVRFVLRDLFHRPIALAGLFKLLDGAIFSRPSREGSIKKDIRSVSLSSEGFWIYG